MYVSFWRGRRLSLSICCLFASMALPVELLAADECDEIASLARQTEQLYQQSGDPYQYKAYLNYEYHAQMCRAGEAGSSEPLGRFPTQPYSNGADLQRIIGTMGNAIDILRAFETMLQQPDNESAPDSEGANIDAAQQQARQAERERLRQEAEAERQRLLTLRAVAIADPCSEPDNPFCDGQSQEPFGATDDNPFERAN